MDVETETSTVLGGGGDLAAALEQATLMAKYLPTTTDPSQLLQIYTTLQSAHRHLSLFLSHDHPPPPPPPPHHPQPTSLPTPPPENSVSSAVGADENDENGGGEPMQMGDDEDEQNSRAATVDKVEERMRECFIQNKRPKRRLSPSAAVAEQRRSFENEGGALALGFDPVGTKLRSLDLIYQFHA